MIELAREFWPDIRWTGSYWRLALKRVVAPLLARGTRPGSPKSPDANPAHAPRLQPARAAIAADPDVLVSLIISTRDRARFLEPFLASLSGVVTRHPWEIIIVDNGSQDETWSILTRFANQSDKNITLIREQKPGLSQARNAGVRAAKGNIICFTDDDCYPRPDLIDSVVEVFEDDGIGFMGGQILLHDPEDDPVCITTRTHQALFPAGSFIVTGDIQGACMAFRREVFADIGLFDTAFGAGGPLKGAEDCEMVARACFAGWNGGFFTEPVIYHHHRRRGEGSAKITWSYDYARGGFFAKLLLKYPGRRKLILQHWYWATPIFWRPSRRTLTKFWREVQGACRYAFSHSWSRPARLDPAIPEPTP
jgi:glycosyltransferase involved in cell wall biosynthesis